MEETISLSDLENKQPFNQKLIKIKPIQSIQHAIEDEPSERNKEIETIQLEIEQMQQELKNLAQQKELLLKQTNLAIEDEKRNWEETKQQLIDNAKHEGFQAGFSQGEHAGKASYEEKLNQANLIIDATTNDYHTTIEKARKRFYSFHLLSQRKLLVIKSLKNQKHFWELFDMLFKN